MDVPKIIDVSSWRQRIDHQAAYDAGVRMMIARSGVGHLYADLAYAYNVQEGEKVGMIVPSYHFFYPDRDPHWQADCTVAGHQGSSKVHVIDLERSQGPLGVDRADRVKAYIDRIHTELGLKPLIYTNYYHWREYYERWATWADQYDLWIAYYTSANTPRIPPPWKKWELWQYTRFGRVPGIDGNVDFNRPKPCGWIEKLVNETL